jgi:hypothetical protein
MRRIGLALGLIVLATLPAQSSDICSDNSPIRASLLGVVYHGSQPGLIVDGVWQPMSEAACRAKAAEKLSAIKSSIDSIVAGIAPAQNYYDSFTGMFTADEAVPKLVALAAAQGTESVLQWERSCKMWADEYAEEQKEKRRERQAERQAAAFAEPARKHTKSESLPAGDSGGAGGSLVESPQSSPAAIPDSGGAGGSEDVSILSTIPDSGGAGGWEKVPPITPTPPPCGGQGQPPCLVMVILAPGASGAIPENPVKPVKPITKRSRFVPGNPVKPVKPITQRRVPAAGLLETGPGFSSQGPAATGTPGAPAGGSSGSGGSLSGSTSSHH